MNSLYPLLFESCLLVFLTGLLIMTWALRHAPEGFQHYNLFYFGTPPAGISPVESADSAPAGPASWH
jgi:hypothetical protein